MDDGNLLQGNAEAMRDELRKSCLMALAVAMRSRQHFDRANRIDAHFRRFPEPDARAERANRRDGAIPQASI